MGSVPARSHPWSQYLCLSLLKEPLGVAVNEFAQRGIGLDHAGVDAEVAALEQAVAVKRAQDELERRLEDLRAEPAAADRKAGVVRRFLFKPVAEEGAKRERVGAVAGDRTLARKVLEEPDHEHLEIDGGVDSRRAALGSVCLGWAADLTDAGGEADAFQSGVEFAVEGAGGGLAQKPCLDPELRLGLVAGVAALEHGRRGAKQAR